MTEPHPLDFYDPIDDDMDIIKYHASHEEWNKKRLNSLLNPPKARDAFRTRKTYKRKDPKTSVWWQDYVLDERGTWRDDNHRDGKLFQRRFALSFDAIHEIIAMLRSDEIQHQIWTEKPDAFGKPAIPLELLVLGSFRVLTRNVTFDDLQEATFASANVHRVFSKDL